MSIFATPGNGQTERNSSPNHTPNALLYSRVNVSRVMALDFLSENATLPDNLINLVTIYC